MTKKVSKDKQEIYMLWQLAAKLAEWQGMPVGMIRNKKDVSLVIGLPSGTLIKNIPLDLAEGRWRSVSELPEESRGVKEIVSDCLRGYLTIKHTLKIPEQKEQDA